MMNRLIRPAYLTRASIAIKPTQVAQYTSFADQAREAGEAISDTLKKGAETLKKNATSAKESFNKTKEEAHDKATEASKKAGKKTEEVEKKIKDKADEHLYTK